MKKISERKIGNGASFQELRFSFTLPYEGKTLDRFVSYHWLLICEANKGKETKIEFLQNL